MSHVDIKKLAVMLLILFFVSLGYMLILRNGHVDSRIEGSRAITLPQSTLFQLCDAFKHF